MTLLKFSVTEFCYIVTFYMNSCVTDVTNSIVIFATALARIPHGNFGVIVFRCCISNNVSLYLILYFFVFMMKQIAKEVCILRISKVEEICFFL